MNARNNTKIGLMVAGVSLLAAWTAPAVVLPFTPDANTVVLYHFDGTTRDDAGMLADSSGHGYNLGANNMDPFTPSVNASFNAALDDTVNGGNGVSITLKGDSYKVEAWMNPQTTTPSGNEAFLKLGGARFWVQNIVGSGFRLVVNDEISGDFAIGNFFPDPTGEWHNFAYTYNAADGKVQLLVDGVDTARTDNDFDHLPIGLGGFNPVTDTTLLLRIGQNAASTALTDTRYLDDVVVSAFAAPVPEPSTVVLLALGGAVLARAKARKK